MSNESFFWKCLDKRIDPLREAIWRPVLGDEFELARRYLAPVSTLAAEAFCERARQTPCRYRIVEHADGSLVGVCDEGRCATRTFERAELIRYEVQHGRLLADLCRLLGIDPRPAPLDPPGISFFVGNVADSSGSPLPILFTRQSNPVSFQRFVQEEILSGRAPFILLTPTLSHLTPALSDLLRRNGCRSIALDGGILLGPRGLTARDRFLAAWKELCASFAPAARQSTLAEFVEEPAAAPAYALICEGATWRFHFRGDHFSVRHSIGLDQLAHLLRHWQHAFTPIEVRQLLDPRELGEASPNGESRETEVSTETASIEAILRIKRRLQQLNQEEAENDGHEVALQEITGERDALEQELMRITTPDGRVRREGGAMDKARKAVSNNIARVLKRREQCRVRPPPLPTHFARFLGGLHA